MISLDEYKNYLVSVYNWPMDNTDLEIEKRREMLATWYPDEYLGKIISDSYDFALDVLSSDTLIRGYYSQEVEEDTTSYIYLGLHGGWHSDTLFTDSKDRLVSRRIMKHIFGPYLDLEVKCDDIVDNSDADVLSYYARNYIYMQGFSSNINEIKEKLLNNEETSSEVMA